MYSASLLLAMASSALNKHASISKVYSPLYKVPVKEGPSGPSQAHPLHLAATGGFLPYLCIQHSVHETVTKEQEISALTGIIYPNLCSPSVCLCRPKHSLLVDNMCTICCLSSFPGVRLKTKAIKDTFADSQNWFPAI